MGRHRARPRPGRGTHRRTGIKALRVARPVAGMRRRGVQGGGRGTAAAGAATARRHATTRAGGPAQAAPPPRAPAAWCHAALNSLDSSFTSDAYSKPQVSWDIRSYTLYRGAEE